jgi:hypothetical protein
MAEYQDILRFLAAHPPRVEPEKKFHASLLEMLAKKLRGESENSHLEVLKPTAEEPKYKKRYH